MNPYLAQRTNVNSLFGTYSIAQDSTTATFDNPAQTNQQIFDYILRGKDGIQNKIVSSDRTIEALTNPIPFITRKRADLVRISNELEDTFKRVYAKEINRGLSHEETKKNVTVEVDRIFDREMKNHHEDFPNDLVSRIVKKLTA